jgi:hypothetical protein
MNKAYKSWEKSLGVRNDWKKNQQGNWKAAWAKADEGYDRHGRCKKCGTFCDGDCQSV